MKAYTDLEQSKRLKEILPLSSADMAWYPSFAKEGYSIRMLNDTYPLDIIGEEYDEIPAWSLIALLEYFKDKFDFELLYLSSTVDNKNNKIKNVYKMSVDMFVDKLDIYATEAIDACYEIILKLNEQNLL